MVFSSVSFLFYFFPLFLLLYALLPFRNATALVFSVLFYMWGEGLFVLVLVASVLINYLFGIIVDRSSVARYRKIALLGGIAVNLLILTYFKYYGFLTLQVLGIEGVAVEDIPHLPLGISFFTFQSISYLADVYLGRAKAATSILDLALYIMMFPQLIAGPIVRYATVARQLRRRVIHYSFVKHGLWFFTVGLSQKVLIADNMAVVADNIFGLPEESLTQVVTWLGTAAYTLQIYFDFAGYSNMAIGIGLIMGFKFPRNFNYPYISQSITEFWRRWHISLSSWFRDYLYIPLGGNRKGAFTTYRNLFVVFLLCGLWHGAAWTFVVWGIYYGLILIVERLGLLRLLGAVPGIFRHVYALLLIMVGWVLFRAESFGQALEFLHHMSGFAPPRADEESIALYINHQQMFFMLIGIVASTPAVRYLTRWLQVHATHDDISRRARAGLMQNLVLFASMASLLLICATYIASGTYSPFLYFRF